MITSNYETCVIKILEGEGNVWQKIIKEIMAETISNLLENANQTQIR